MADTDTRDRPANQSGAAQRRSDPIFPFTEPFKEEATGREEEDREVEEAARVIEEQTAMITQLREEVEAQEEQLRAKDREIQSKDGYIEEMATVASRHAQAGQSHRTQRRTRLRRAIDGFNRIKEGAKQGRGAGVLAMAVFAGALMTGVYYTPKGELMAEVARVEVAQPPTNFLKSSVS